MTIPVFRQLREGGSVSVFPEKKSYSCAVHERAISVNGIYDLEELVRGPNGLRSAMADRSGTQMHIARLLQQELLRTRDGQNGST
ncbi:unnamed protein product [Cylicocyclus nassatus]|uniref:Uncharacterized protein n=1 Tax=Cylicocyclus nassatus TaxID=53992 RepID=A0AA36GIM3_CYLNA|nr:unnamed protein product [Cylicocyclus nassatus]